MAAVPAAAVTQGSTVSSRQAHGTPSPPNSNLLWTAWLWGPVAAYMALMFYLSAQSYPPVPPRVWDKLLHGLEYFGLAVLVFRALSGGLPAMVTVRRALLTLAITVGYGASDEVHQLFVPLRSADFRDLLADAFGAVAALIVCWACHIIWVSHFTSRVPRSTSQR